MNTLSSLLQWIGNTIGANPNTLTTTAKTLVGAINEVRARTVSAFIIENINTVNGYDYSANQNRTITMGFTPKTGYTPITIKAYSNRIAIDLISFYIIDGESRVTMNTINRTSSPVTDTNFTIQLLWVRTSLLG